MTTLHTIRSVLIVIPPLVSPEESQGTDPTLPDFETRRLVSPVEPVTVAADLRNRGFDVKLFDYGIYPDKPIAELSAYLEAFTPDALAIVQSILTFATAQDWDGKSVFDLARKINPSVVTVLTGNTATNYPGKAVGEGVCDYSIRGEVDFALGDLLSSLNSALPLDEMPGLSSRAAGKTVVTSAEYPNVDIKSLPLPAYDLIDPEQRERYCKIHEVGKIRYPSRSPHYRDIMTSRSCILRCSFCSVAHLRGPRQKHRRKTTERVLSEIEQALDQGVQEIHFFDDLFAESEAKIIDFSNTIVKRGLRFSWFVAQGFPLWPLTRDALSAMTEAGMYRVIAPFESGNDRVLREVVGKIYSTTEHHHNVAKWSKQLGLELIGMFVVGMPGETRSDIRDTVLFAQNHLEIDYAVFSIATPMIGTRLMRKVIEQRRLDDPTRINRVIRRSVGLFRTDAFAEYELGVIRAFDWDRINFSTPERQKNYARMVGLSLEQLKLTRDRSISAFQRFFPDYDGPRSFLDLYDQPNLFEKMEPVIPAAR